MDILSTKNKKLFTTTGLFFVFALLSRLLYIIYQPLKDTDYELIHIAADNLIAGKGLAFPRTFLNNLSVIYYDPMRYWPPLTAILVAGVKAITNSVVATDLILLFIGMITVMFILKKIIAALDLSPLFQIIAWLILATNPEPFRSIGISDLYGCVFGLWSVLLCIRYFQSTDQNKKIPILASFIFFLPAAFRYQYYPVIFVFPLFMMLAAKVLKNPALLRKAIFSFFLVGFFLGLQLLYLSYSTNSIIYANDPKGFFPSNLAFMYPIFIKTVVNSSYIENKLQGFLDWFNLTYLITNLLFFIIVYTWLTGYFLHTYRKIKKASYEICNDGGILLQFLFFAVSTAVIFTLVAASLIYNSRSGKFGGWTYVGEARYYMIPGLLFLMMLLKILQQNMHRSKIIALALGLVLTCNAALWCKFIYNIFTDKLSNKEIQNITDRAAIEQKIIDLQKNSLPVIVSYTEPYFAFFSIRKQYAITKKVNFLLDSGYKTSAPVQLFIITEKLPGVKETDFLLRNHAKEVFTGGRCKMFYILAEKNSISK